MRTAAFLLIACSLALSGCRKDDVDVDALNYNAFDQDYDGPPIFELENVWIDSYVNSVGVTIPRLNADINLLRHRLTNANVSFTIRHRFQGLSWTNYVLSTGSNETFSSRRDGFTSGQTYCVELQIGTDQTYTDHGTICFTAP